MRQFYKILELLAVRSELTVDEIIEKIKLSRNQVYNVLKMLIENEFIEKVKRGKYRLANDSRTSHLAMFYRENLIMQIGSYLQSIIEERKKTDIYAKKGYVREKAQKIAAKQVKFMYGLYVGGRELYF